MPNKPMTDLSAKAAARPQLIGNVTPGVMRGIGIRLAGKHDGSRRRPLCVGPWARAPGRCASNELGTFAMSHRAPG
jgi:hypothetical protein